MDGKQREDLQQPQQHKNECLWSAASCRAPGFHTLSQFASPGLTEQVRLLSPSNGLGN